MIMHNLHRNRNERRSQIGFYRFLQTTKIETQLWIYNLLNQKHDPYFFSFLHFRWVIVLQTKNKHKGVCSGLLGHPKDPLPKYIELVYGNCPPLTIKASTRCLSNVCIKFLLYTWHILMIISIAAGFFLCWGFWCCCSWYYDLMVLLLLVISIYLVCQKAQAKPQLFAYVYVPRSHPRILPGT